MPHAPFRAYRLLRREHVRHAHAMIESLEAGPTPLDVGGAGVIRFRMTTGGRTWS